MPPAAPGSAVSRGTVVSNAGQGLFPPRVASRRHRPWTRHQDAELLAGALLGLSERELARKVGHPTGSCRTQLAELRRRMNEEADGSGDRHRDLSRTARSRRLRQQRAESYRRAAEQRQGGDGDGTR